jgi:threonine synthase
VLDEFFRTGTYRVRKGAETHETSSPSMDISKASNFERFIFDLLGRDAGRTRQLFKDEVDAKGSFTLTPEEFRRIAEFGFVSGRSTHADRVATIRDTWERCGVMIDTHTADGVKVAREHLNVATTMLVLETALPAKFAATIVEALGREPERPAAHVGIEELPKRFVVLPADVEKVKAVIELECAVD